MVKERWHNDSGLCLTCGRLPRPKSAYCSQKCMKQFMYRIHRPAKFNVPMPTLLINEFLRKLLSGPMKRSEIKTPHTDDIMRALNRELPEGKRVVSRQEKGRSRLGLTVKETVYELVTVK